MPLTLRTNGSSSSNLITASWFNDFYNLFTGNMTDQEVTFAQSLILKAIGGPPPYSTSSLSAVTGSGLGVGAYGYQTTFLSIDGETLGSSFGYVTTTTGYQQVQFSGLPLGPTGTVARRLYRSAVGNVGPYHAVTTINDNVTTTYLDTSSDTSIANNTTPPTSSTFGGCLYLKDYNGNITFSVKNDGTMSGLKVTGVATLSGSLSVVGTTSLDNGFITTDGNGNINLPSGGTITGGNFIFGTNATQGLTWQHYSGQTKYIDAQLYAESGGYLVVSAAAFGVKSGGTKLMEVKNSGNMIISGTQYQTSAASVGTASGQSFDSFDVAEVYEFDASYPNGTVVCPGPNNLMTMCTHDNCPCAMVISNNPGFLMGSPDTTTNVSPIALVGRVNVNTSAVITERSLVCSDGKGGVRAVVPGQLSYVLGFALNTSLNGQVGIALRPLCVTL